MKRLGVFSLWVALAGCTGGSGGGPADGGGPDAGPGADTGGDAASDLPAADGAGDAELPGPPTDATDFREPESDLGKPCDDPSDCLSGLCVEAPGGSICTDTCIEECPAGWICKGVNLFGTDLQFICVPRYWSLCEPCAEVADCESEEGACLDVGGDGTFCTVTCAASSDCPAEFSCVPGEDGASVCRPASGSCTCLAEHLGTVEACQVSNDHGACDGERTCGEAGWSPCSASTPGPELCDAADNNCDGYTDEGFPLLGTACDGPDDDSCAGGTWTCTASGDGEECVNDDGGNSPELCDGQDNDCDGDIDESFLLKDQPCDSGDPDLCAMGTWTCSADLAELECVNETQTDILEICNGADDDCDGQVDEGFPGKGQPCDSDDSDLCAKGTWTCTASGDGLECVNETETGVQEICDYLDNDCDGQFDEGFPTLGDPCDGADSDQCKHGTLTCKQNGTGIECVNETVVNIPETCNGLDDDCDGQPDPVGTSGCTTFYKDSDNDGFGDASTAGKCYCQATGSFKVLTATDCYDGNGAAHPGQTQFFAVHRGDGSFDYDCSGSETKQWTQVAGGCVLLGDLCSGSDGWNGPVPACGVAKTWLFSCYWDLPFFWQCAFDSENRTQKCQ